MGNIVQAFAELVVIVFALGCVLCVYGFGRDDMSSKVLKNDLWFIRKHK